MTEQRTSRAEIAIVIGLFVLAAGLWAATLLHGKGVWFQPAAARLIYHLLWTLLWLPGIVILGLVFARHGRVVLLVGIALQLAAILAYWRSDALLPLAASAGFLGLALPLLMAPRGERLRHRALAVLFAACVCAFTYLGTRFGDFDWTWAIVVGFLWVPYLCLLSPKLDQHVRELFRQEDEWRKRSKLYRWIERITLFLFLGTLMLGAVVLAICYFLLSRVTTGGR